MATIKVYFKEIWDYDNRTRIFRTSEGASFEVNSFEEGIAVAKPICGWNTTSFIEMIASCFDAESNFVSELFKAFNCEENATFTGIHFELNGVTLLVTKENASKDKIYAEWEAVIEANAEKYRLEREEYMKTPEYRAERANYLKIQTRRDQVEQEVLAIDESTELEFKDDEAKANWEKWVETNSKDGYSFKVVKFARRWAKYMQHLMKKHSKTLPEIADDASYASNTEGITSFMCGWAVGVLTQFWKYGEELSRWHNKKSGQEDSDGVVNLLC